MNSHSQAALEYLMTYGWALVIIVTIASVLFFVMSPPASQFQCTSSDPTKIVLKSYDLKYNSFYSGISQRGWGYSGENPNFGLMTLQNATGGPISITTVAPDTWQTSTDGCINRRSFTPLIINNKTFYDISSTNPVNVSSGQQINIQLYLTIQRLPSGYSCNIDNFKQWTTTHTFQLTYKDQFGYSKTISVFCQNYPPTS